jgi:hypothetical protein
MLFTTGHVSLAMLLVTATMVLLLVLEGVWFTRLDEAPITPDRGELVGTEDDKHQDHCHREDGRGVEDVDQPLRKGENRKRSSAGTKDEASYNDGDEIEGVGLVTADKDEEDDEGDNEVSHQLFSAISIGSSKASSFLIGILTPRLEYTPFETALSIHQKSSGQVPICAPYAVVFCGEQMPVALPML